MESREVRYHVLFLTIRAELRAAQTSELIELGSSVTDRTTRILEPASTKQNAEVS
jgi:hypothetical protein